MAKTYDKQLNECDEKIAQYGNRKKQILQKKREEERKARNHRLIERGALLESLMGVTDEFTNEQIKEVLAIALNGAEARSALLKLRQPAASAGKERASPENEA